MDRGTSRAAALGDREVARTWLEEACPRAPFLVYVDMEPAMAVLLENAHCRALLRRPGFDAARRSARA